MSPLYETIMETLRKDGRTSFLRDASRSTPSGAGTSEAIRVRLQGRDYEIKIEEDWT